MIRLLILLLLCLTMNVGGHCQQPEKDLERDTTCDDNLELRCYYELEKCDTLLKSCNLKVALLNLRCDNYDKQIDLQVAETLSLRNENKHLKSFLYILGGALAVVTVGMVVK